MCLAGVVIGIVLTGIAIIAGLVGLMWFLIHKALNGVFGG